MPWGVFEVKDKGQLKEVHVVPCSTQGVLPPTHKLSCTCPCGPQLADARNTHAPVWVHYQEQ